MSFLARLFCIAPPRVGEPRIAARRVVEPPIVQTIEQICFEYKEASKNIDKINKCILMCANQSRSTIEDRQADMLTAAGMAKYGPTSVKAQAADAAALQQAEFDDFQRRFKKLKERLKR